jgi:hypothetical protein
MKTNIEIDLPPDFYGKVVEIREILGFENNAEVLYYSTSECKKMRKNDLSTWGK